MKIEPENFELWNRFQSCERNEMIITKSGRCLFPVLKFNVALEESDYPAFSSDAPFSYGLEMERVDSYKWKYRHDHWYATVSTSNNTPHILETNPQLYEPESSSILWSQIIHEGLNFSKVKLTNRKGSMNLSYNASNRLIQNSNSSMSNYFSLCSFGNYVPVVYLLDWNCFFQHHSELSVSVSIAAILRNYDKKTLETEGSLKCIQIKECAFIAVTHYQNELITHLKKHNNPHAKGFILTDENISGINFPITRGKPGRKRKYPLPLEYQYQYQTDNEILESLSEDVIMASLALEKMSNGNVPRSEIVKSPLDSEKLKLIRYNVSNDNSQHKFLKYYNKLN